MEDVAKVIRDAMICATLLGVTMIAGLVLAHLSSHPYVVRFEMDEKGLEVAKIAERVSQQKVQECPQPPVCVA